PARRRHDHRWAAAVRSQGPVTFPRGARGEHPDGAKPGESLECRIKVSTAATISRGMRKTPTRRVIVPRWRSLSYPLPELPRRRPRSYEEWSALRRWGRLPREEETVAGFLL